MNDYIYNPVLRQTRFDAMLDAASDVFYGSAVGQFLLQFGALVALCGSVAGVLAVGSVLLG